MLFSLCSRWGLFDEFVQRGTWEACPLTPRMIELAELCSRIFQAPVAGVDLLEVDDDDYVVIEVNTTPAITWPHMETVRHVADLIEQRVHLSFGR